MNSKMKSKSNNTINKRLNKNKINRINLNEKLSKEKQYSKKKNIFSQKNNKDKKTKKYIKKKKKKSCNNNNPSNIEDSSTNCFSGNKNKNFITKLDNKFLSEKKIENFIPFLISKENDTESLFINFKLGEKDSYTESTLRSDSKNYNNYNYVNNIKLTNKNYNNYNYCEVDDSIGKNEIDSLEIYDFNDKTNVDYVLKNLSALSCSKSGKDKSSIILNECNDEDISGNKNINKIKVFNAKQNSKNFFSKIKVNKSNYNKFGTYIKNKIQLNSAPKY